MARRYFRGGGFTLRTSGGTAADDGDWDYDNGSGGAKSNWLDDAGAAAAKPIDGTDEAIFSEFASIVPLNYSEASEPHQPGKHFCCCKGMDQGSGGNDIDLKGITFTPGYDPGAGNGLFGWISKLLAATETDDDGGLTEVYCTGHTFAVGDYATIGGTVYLDGEWRITATTANTFTIPLAYIIETPPTTATVVARRPLRIGITAGYEIVFQSNCTAYIEASHDTLNIESCVFDSVSGLLHLSSDIVGVRNWNEIRSMNKGTLIVAPDTEFTKLIITKDATTGVAMVGTGCLGPAAVSCDLEMDAGSCVWDSKIGDVLMNGGSVVYCQNVDLATTVNIDKAEIYGDAEFEWWGKSTIAILIVWGGLLVAKGSGVKSIDYGGAMDHPLRGGTIDLEQAGGPISLGGSNTIDKQGGDLKCPDRTKVSF